MSRMLTPREILDTMEYMTRSRAVTYCLDRDSEVLYLVASEELEKEYQYYLCTRPGMNDYDIMHKLISDGPLGNDWHYPAMEDAEGISEFPLMIAYGAIWGDDEEAEAPEGYECIWCYPGYPVLNPIDDLIRNGYIALPLWSDRDDSDEKEEYDDDIQEM